MTSRDDTEARPQVFAGGRVGTLVPVGRWRLRRGPRRKDPTGREPDASELSSLWKRNSVRRILGGVSALAAVMALGVAGYTALGWNPFDALFMVVITVSGVGYGEVLPLDSLWLRIHTMLIIAFGLVAVAYTV